MQMKKVKLPVILALVTIVCAVGWAGVNARAAGFDVVSLGSSVTKVPKTPDVSPANGDPDVPSGIKRLSALPHSDGSRWTMPRGFGELPGLRRAWITWMISRWLAS